MTMSLDTMAKSRTYHPPAAESMTQPGNRLSSPELKREYSLSDQTNVDEKDSSPSEASVALSSESSSNYQYETSSEGPPQKIRELRSTPINVGPAVHNHYRLRNATEALESHEKIASEPETVGNTSKNFRKIRCESFPVVKNKRQLDFQDVPINRSISESSQACTNKFKKIVAEVESTGWSGSNVTLFSENTSKDDSAPRPPDASAETINPAPVIREAFGLFNKTRGVTFLPLKEANGSFASGKWERRDLQPYFTENSTSKVKLIENNGKVIEDLVDIAANPNPSIKSIYFPPSPKEAGPVADLETVARQTRIATLSPRYRSELDALSRIEDELGPLRCKFSELAAKVQALNLIGVGYDFCMDPSIPESPGRSTISRDTSGYFLHRAQPFCRNDSVKAFPMSLESKVSTLPTVDNSVLHGNSSARGSCIWHENIEAEFAGSLHHPPNSAVHVCLFTPRTSYGNSFHSPNREVRSSHEKPFAYGCSRDSPLGNEYLPEKPDRFHNAMLQHAHSRHRHWNAWKSTLPNESLSNFHRRAEQKFTTHWSNNIQPRTTTGQLHETDRPNPHGSINSHERAESEEKNINLIGSKSSVASTRDRNFDHRGAIPQEPVGRRSSRVSREHSMTNRTSSGRMSINRVSSGRRSTSSVKDAQDSRHGKLRRSSVEQVAVESNSKRLTAEESKRANSRSSDLHNCKHSRVHLREERHASRESFVSTKSALYRDRRVAPTNDIVLATSKSKFDACAANSSTRDMEANASTISYSRESNSSRTRFVVCESASLDSSRDQQQIEFTDAYSESTVVRLDSVSDLQVADSPRLELCPFGELRASPVEQESPSNRFGFSEDAQDSDGPDEKDAKVPDSDEKVTIVPVMYTSGIPEAATLREFESATPGPGKTERMRYEVHPVVVGKTHSGDRRFSPGQSEVLSGGSEASGNFTTRLARVARVGHERSYLGQWRTTDGKLSITYSRSNTSIRATSVFSGINNEGTVRMDEAVSRLTVSNSPRIRSTRDRSPTASTVARGNALTYHARRNHSPDASTRRTSNDGLGIGTLPDDFLDDV